MGGTKLCFFDLICLDRGRPRVTETTDSETVAKRAHCRLFLQAFAQCHFASKALPDHTAQNNSAPLFPSPCFISLHSIYHHTRLFRFLPPPNQKTSDLEASHLPFCSLSVDDGKRSSMITLGCAEPARSRSSFLQSGFVRLLQPFCDPEVTSVWRKDNMLKVATGKPGKGLGAKVTP